MAQAQAQAQPVAGTKHGDHEVEAALAKREGWWKPFFLFQGCWLPIPAVKSTIAMQAQFRPRPDDIIIATYPKCGTTWLKSLAFAIARRSQHPIAGGGHPLLSSNSHDLVPFLELPFRDLHPIAELEELPSPRILGTHLPLTLLPSSVTATVGCRIVYLCREPKDVLVSTWHYWNKVQADFHIELDQAFELFCEGVSICGPIWEHCLGYWKHSRRVEAGKQVLFLKYGEMMASPIEHVKTIAEFLGVPFTDAEESGGVLEEVVRLCSFENLKALPVNCSGVSDPTGDNPKLNSAYFRSAKVGDWVNHLSEEMAQKLDCIVEVKLKGSGLSF